MESKISSLVILFQLFGVVTLRSKLSVCWTFASVIITMATIFTAYAIGPATFFKVKTIAGQTRDFTHLILFSSRVLVFVSSISNVDKFHKILNEFDCFDRTLHDKFEIEVNTRSRIIRLAIKLILILTVMMFMSFVNFAFPKVNKLYWLISTTSIHITHVKETSLIFFVDSVNYRLQSLQLAARKIKALDILALHSRLRTASKLINESHEVVTLTVLFNNLAILLMLFYLFITICSLEVVIPLTRKLLIWWVKGWQLKVYFRYRIFASRAWDNNF